MNKIIITILIFLLIFSSVTIKACTVFNGTNEGITLVGRNMDWYTQENYVAFLPSEEGKFGRVYFGWNEFPSWYQGGMNSQGVMFAYLSAPYLSATNSLLKPVYRGNYGNLMEKCMEECSSVEDVTDVFDQYNLYFLENCHVMVVDSNGDSVIIGGDDITNKDEDFQVVTNFRPNNPSLGGYPCWRYDKAYEMLEGMTFISVDYFTEILSETHMEGDYPTQWSIVYDLVEYNIHLYHFHDFRNVITFNLNEELEIGEHVYSIPALFESSDNQPPNTPINLDGPFIGKIGSEYIFTCSATNDPDNEPDELYYLFDWGDNSDSGWIKPLISSIVSAPHIWNVNGNFEVMVKSKDIYGAESEWSDPLVVSMSKTISINDFNPWILRLFQQFPILEFLLFNSSEIVFVENEI
jgi:hypothetical protein